MGFRVLFTEAESPLASVLLKHFEEHTFVIVCPEPGTVDWQDPLAVRTLLEQARPALVINTLQWAQPLRAFERPGFYEVLADIGRELDLTLIHVSSHEVFPAVEQESPWLEQDLPEPISPAGIGLRSAELAFLEIPRCLVLRLSWMLDIPGGILDKVCDGLLGGEVLNVSDRWRGEPTSCDDAARAVVAIVQQVLCGAENWGVFHFRTSDACSEAEFADCVARFMTKAGCATGKVNVVPVDQRLMVSSGWLGGQRCTNNFGIQLRSWRQGVKAKVHEWLARHAAAGQLDFDQDKPPKRQPSVQSGAAES